MRSTSSAGHWSWAILLAGAVAGSMAAAEYELDGTIDQEMYYGGEGGVQWHERSDFTVYFRDGSWLIRLVPPNTTGIPEAIDEYGSPNGAEIFQLRIPLQPRNAATNTNPRPAVSNAPPGSLQPAPPPYMLVLVSNSVPVASDDGSVIGHLWLMFASQEYFQHLRTNRLTPPYDFNASVMGGNPHIKLAAEWELMSGPARLPLKVVYYNGGGFYNANANGELLFHRYGPPYNDGFTGAVYRATGVLQAGQVRVPGGFVFEEFAPRVTHRSKDDLILRRRAEAVVTAVRPVCSRRSLAPVANDRTLVDDWRLVQAQPPIKHFAYMRPQVGRWISVGESRKYHDRLAHPKKASRVTLTLLVAVLVTPLAFFAARRIWKTRHR